MPHREILRDPAAKIVADDGRVRDAQHIEQREHALRMRLDAELTTLRTIASPIAQQIDDDYTMPVRNQRYHVAPDVRGCREAVQEHDGLAAAAVSSRVVVEANAADVHEFTAHQ
jgi:hypothetical protein